MDVISRRSSASGLNPNALMFVPQAYRAVEDFSDQWWDLVQSSPCFRDYWLRERFHDPQNDPLFPDFYDHALLPDIDYFLFDQEYLSDEHDDHDDHFSFRKVGEVAERRLVRIGRLGWRRGQAAAEPPKYAEKAPKIVRVKVSPRTIQQPR